MTKDYVLVTDEMVERAAQAMFPSVCPFAEVGCCHNPDFERCKECANDVREIARDGLTAALTGGPK